MFTGCPSDTDTGVTNGSYELLFVVDGDTLAVNYGGKEEHIRFLRINTPERDQPGYDEAADALMYWFSAKVTHLSLLEHKMTKSHDA